MQELQEFENLLGIKYLAVHFHNRILTFLSSTSLYTFIMALTSALKNRSGCKCNQGFAEFRQ